MKFEDVVQNGVLQAYQKRIDKHDRLITTERRKRLLEYKGERIERSLIAALKRGGTPLIIWD